MFDDVLTFYQGRLANESYLRTAQAARSVLELGALVGYRLNPGARRRPGLRFRLKPQAAAIVIPSGTQVQSVPGPSQKAQTFELHRGPGRAGPKWSALAAQTSQGWQPARGDTSLYLAGISTQVNPGDVILIVGAERIGHPNNENWDARVVTTVAADPVRRCAPSIASTKDWVAERNGRTNASAIPSASCSASGPRCSATTPSNPNLLATTRTPPESPRPSRSSTGFRRFDALPSGRGRTSSWARPSTSTAPIPRSRREAGSC